MTKKTNVVRASLTGIGGILGASIAVVVVATLTLVPLPQIFGAAPSFKVSPIASAQSLVCPGPLVQTNPEKSTTVSYLTNGTPTVLTESNSSQMTKTPLVMTENKAPATYGTPQVISVPANKGSGDQPLIAGTQLQTGAGESLAGLATIACAEPSNDMWLVGGATEVGRTTLLLLENSTDVYSTAKIEIFTENGPVTIVKNDGVQVPPHTQRIVSLAGYARDAISPIVHVTSTGGALLATMQLSVVRTLVPSGVEWVNPSAPANTTQVMTGVYITGGGDDAEHGAVVSDLESAIRVFIPGTEGATVTIKVVSLSGEVTEISGPLNAKEVVQFPFVGVKEGMYTVIVTSSKPLLAGVRSVIAAGVQSPVLSTSASPPPVSTSTPTSTPTPTPSATSNAQSPTKSSVSGGDFAWFTSGSFLTPSLLLPVPTGPNPMVSFYNPQDFDIVVTLSARNQQDVKLTVVAKRMVTTKLVGGASYTVNGTEGLIGQLTYIGGGQGSGMALSPANALGSAIMVYPR